MMEFKTYGITQSEPLHEMHNKQIEEIKRRGYSIIENLVPVDECDRLTESLFKIYEEQKLEFSEEKLKKINEEDMVRMPLAYDKKFLDLINNEKILDPIKSILGTEITLHLQNGIINRPNIIHHQTSWHRDLPYQEWTISKPISMNAFICLTDFTKKNGATAFLPYSQKFDSFPSQSFASENLIQITASKGSVILFDSMLYHKATPNKDITERIGINNVFVVPIIKPQIEFNEVIQQFNLSTKESELLGNKYKIPSNVKEFREFRFIKKKEKE